MTITLETSGPRFYEYALNVLISVEQEAPLIYRNNIRLINNAPSVVYNSLQDN